MKFPDLRSFLAVLETAGELVRVSEELSPRYEAAAAIKALAQRQGKAVRLDRVKGYTVPVVGNLLGNRQRLAMAMGVSQADLPAAYLKGKSQPVRPKLVDRGPVQAVVHDRDIDITATIPVLTHHQKDAGPYFTCTFVVAKDPETGVRGLGIHRIQVKNRDTVGVFFATPPLSDFLAKAERQNKPLEIAIVSGADPLLYFTSPQAAPPGVDKYDIAGGLARSPVELVKCLTVDIEVPAHAEFVLEGALIPNHREKEGPLGESTGYYLTYNNPIARIKAITHRRDPIYHALVPFGPEETILMLPRFQMEALAWLQGIMPSVRQMHSPAYGVVYVQLEKQAETDTGTVIDALFTGAAAPYAKVVVVVDTDVDILNPGEMAWALGSRFRPDKDVTIRPDLPGLIIDPSTQGSERQDEFSRLNTRTAKIGIDATKPLGKGDKFEKVDVPPEVKRKIDRLLGG